MLTDEAARKVHKSLFGKVWNWAGDYRGTEKNIGVPIGCISTEMRTCLDSCQAASNFGPSCAIFPSR